MQRPCGKGSVKGAGSEFLLGQPADEFYGRGGNSFSGGYYRRRDRRRIRRQRKGRSEISGKAGCGFPVRIPEHEDAAHCVTGVPYYFDVFLYGAYDVGIPTAAVPEWKSCRDGTCSAAADCGRYGDKSAFLHKRIQGAVPGRSEYGHAGCPGSFRGVRIQYICAVCHD